MVSKKVDSESPSGASENEIPLVQGALAEHIEAAFPSKVFRLPEHAWHAYGLTYGARREDAREVFTELRDGEQFLFDMLVDLTCVDWMDRREPRFDVVYQLLSITHRHRLCIKIKVEEDNPEVDSVLPLWPAANFMEREAWDMYGVTFAEHGDLRRILMYDEFVGHPLRKDYPKQGKQPRVPLRVPELRNTSADMHREQLVSLPTRGRG